MPPHDFRNAAERNDRNYVPFAPIVALGVLLLTCGALDAAKIEHDSGPIVAVEGDRIIVEGQKGTHILEIVGWRPWIRGDLEVLVEFSGVLSVVVRPFAKSPAAKPVKASIVRDGREGR